MRIGQIIGKVTLSRCHPLLESASWRLAVPLTEEGIKNAIAKQGAIPNDDAGRGEPFVIYDDRGGSNGMIVAISEGPEASAPFHPEQKPIDGYNSAILDHIEFK